MLTMFALHVLADGDPRQNFNVSNVVCSVDVNIINVDECSLSLFLETLVTIIAQSYFMQYHEARAVTL